MSAPSPFSILKFFIIVFKTSDEAQIYEGLNVRPQTSEFSLRFDVPRFRWKNHARAGFDNQPLLKDQRNLLCSACICRRFWSTLIPTLCIVYDMWLLFYIEYFSETARNELTDDEQISTLTWIFEPGVSEIQPPPPLQLHTGYQ